MHRTTVAALAAGPLLMSTAGLGHVSALASAAPVDTGRMAAVTVTVPLPDDETLSLDIRAAQLSDGPQLSIETTRCNGQSCTTKPYASPLDEGALSIDPSQAVAHLRTRLDGRDLEIIWRPADGEHFGAGYINGSGLSVSTSNYIGDAAEATVQFDGDQCTGAAGVGQGVVGTVDVADDSATAPVDRLHLPATTTLRC